VQYYDKQGNCTKSTTRKKSTPGSDREKIAIVRIFCTISDCQEIKSLVFVSNSGEGIYQFS